MDISKFTPEQKQAVMVQAQQEANQRVMQGMVKSMVTTCFQKCAGTSVSLLQIQTCVYMIGLINYSYDMQISLLTRFIYI